MLKTIIRSVAFLGVLALSACASTNSDETAGWDAKRIYQEAKESLSDGDYERAIKYFERLEARYPYGRYAQQAQIETAWAHYKSGEPELTIAAAERFIRLHPDHPNVDYVYYLKGLATFNEDLGLLGRLVEQDLSERDPKGARESFETFKDLVARFPDSRYAVDARQRMRYLVNALARHEIHVARYYFSRGAYVAAVKRAQAAIENYPDSPAQEAALVLLVKSYDALGLQQSRDDAQRILQQNYPDSRFLADGLEVKKSWWKFW